MPTMSLAPTSGKVLFIGLDWSKMPNVSHDQHCSCGAETDLVSTAKLKGLVASDENLTPGGL